MIKNKQKLILLSTLGFCLSLNAQNGSLSTGGDIANSSGSIAYSIGQPFYQIATNGNEISQEGLQQAFEISQTLSKKEIDLNLELSAFPNPIINELQIKIDVSLYSSLTYAFYSATGKLIQKGKINSNTTLLNTQLLKTGVYLLNIIDKSQSIKTFKILKK